MFEDLGRCLAQAGARFEDVVKLTFSVLDVADLAAVRAAHSLHIKDYAVGALKDRSLSDSARIWAD